MGGFQNPYNQNQNQNPYCVRILIGLYNRKWTVVPGERRMTSPESGVTELVNISTVSTALPTNRMVASEVATRIAETQFLLKEEEEGREDFDFSKN